MTESDKGILILGAPRSGTTLVRRILNAHPDIACPGETCLFSAWSRFLQTETVADDLDFGVISGLSFAGFDPAEVIERLRSFACQFHREYADKQGKRRWAEKTAVDVFHLDRIEELMGDSVQYLFVVRHGLDVACSTQEFSDRSYAYLTELHQYVRQYPRPLEAFAHAWVDACRSMLDFMQRNPGNSHLVRYENLIADPHKEIAALFKFLGEAAGAEIGDAAMNKPQSAGFGDWKTFSRNSFDTSSVQRWKSLPRNVTRRLADICNKTLQALDYEPIETRPPDSQAVARRKYEFSVRFDANINKVK